MSGSILSVEKPSPITQKELDGYMRVHGFEVTEDLRSLVGRIGPAETLSYMRSIVDDFEGGLREEGLPIFIIAKETRTIDFAAAISEKIEEREKRFPNFRSDC